MQQARLSFRVTPNPLRSACAILLISALSGGCGREPAPIESEHVWTVEAPPAALVLTLEGAVGNLREEIVKAPVEQLRLKQLAKIGEIMEPGAVVVEYDTDWLDLWIKSNDEHLALIERRLRATKLSDQKRRYGLNDDILAKETTRTAKRLEIEESKTVDHPERAILERSLKQARERLETARLTLEALKKVEAVGGASAAEVRTAMVTYEQAVVGIKMPEVRLMEFDREDGSDDRVRLEQELDWLNLLLRDDKQFGSLRSELSRAVAKQDRDKRGLVSEHQRLSEGAEEAIQASTNPVYRTESGGLVAPSDNGAGVPMVPGAALGARRIVTIISPGDPVIEVRVPEAMRNSIRLNEGDQWLVRVRIPSLGAQWLQGKLTSISPVKEYRRGGSPYYRGKVVLASSPTTLSPGVSAVCELTFPVPSTAVVIPSWWATRDFRPVAHLASGKKQRLVAQRLGDNLLVTRGLSVGTKVLPPKPETERPLIFYSTVYSSENDRIVVKGSGWEWAIEELVDDGTYVEAGQVVCRLRRVYGRKVRDNAADLAKLRADLGLQLSRMNANGALGDAFMNWQQALGATETKRLAYLRLRTKVNDVALAQAESDAALADINHRQVKADFVRFSAPVYAELRSENQHRQDKLNMQVGGLQYEKSAIAAAATRQARIWDNVQYARQNWRMAADNATVLDHGYQQARITHRTKIASAEAKHVDQMREVEELILEAGSLELTAPVSGRLHYNPKCWRAPAIGVTTYTPHLFNIPRGTEREFSIHVPGRLYQVLKVGQELSLYLPANGSKKLTGKITHIADYFEKRRGNRGGRGSSDQEATVDDEKTVKIQVAFSAQNERTALPGATVVVEIEP